MPSIIYFVYNSILVTALILAVHFYTNKNEKENLLALKILMIMILFGITGARLFHVFYEEPDYYLADPVRILYFWQGGFVYYGGFVSAISAASVFLYVKKENFWKWADFFTVFASLAYAFGRIGCYISGCCYGSYHSFPWGFYRHPTQIYSSLLELFALLILLKTRNKKVKSGQFFICWVIYHCINRLIVEPYRDDFRGENILGLSISTVISVALLVTALVVLALKSDRLKKWLNAK